MDEPRFPDGFVWGVASSAFQVEGALEEDGRGVSVWDAFTRRPGVIRDGHTADVACDHYHRYGEDIALLAELGVDVYRFSIAWPRVVPAGAGAVNPRGLDFYERLVDGLLERGITPLPTLFHWDLPQALEDAGGWLERDTAHRFAEYVSAVAVRLGDRVGAWITLNEPFEHMSLGYALGEHAPGRTLLLDALPAAHHQLLGHGLAARLLREEHGAKVLLTNSYSPARPARDTPADRGAADAYDALHRRLFTDPVLLGRYPDLSAYGLAAGALPYVRDGDLAVISAPLDGLGVNYYNPTLLAAPPAGSPLPFDFAEFPPGVPRTAFGWPVVPDGLTQTLVELTELYGEALPPLWITENGCSCDAYVEDGDRVAYLDAHVRAVHAAIERGADVRGYLVWTLTDNFEWAEGYHQRFGLVHVDHETQKRTPRASFTWYRDLIAAQRRPRAA
ncbi:GH1 family beta-glucosidase [Bailinhaonella thermotolerans]|uniref:Beta-glucosidase n=1 Tax=Bailinhaonella thermotolerans TaxID=1070861 RepID=A0A3A4ANI9_9ACTN|nr:GH1 family beta-glucosidase [Bailinhaonella thermotolerans]RJL27180.1 beta-glucosidase [Bailinhaonella thermotolerans]